MQSLARRRALDRDRLVLDPLLSSEIQSYVTLATLVFVPAAVKLDRYGQKFGKDSLLSKLAHLGAQVVSLFSENRVFEIRFNLTDNFTSNGEAISAPILTNLAGAYATRLFDGNDVTFNPGAGSVVVPIVITLLWGLGNSTNMMAVYSSIKRAVPKCVLSVEQSIQIPEAHALFKEKVYIPNHDLVTISVPQSRA